MAIERPNVFQWLWFAFGGRLPMRYREWVLRDAASRSWLWRFAIRALVRVSPLVLVALVVLWLVRAHFGIAIAAVVLGGIVSLYYAMSYAPERVDQQLVAYGYPPGTAERMRDQRSEAKHEGRRERYERTWRQSPDT